MNAHTPLPWAVSQGFDLGEWGKKPANYVAGPDPKAIGIKLATPFIEGAWDDDDEARANADFIVLACNAHYELVQAVEGLLTSHRQGKGQCCKAADFAFDTLEKVKGK